MTDFFALQNKKGQKGILFFIISFFVFTVITVSFPYLVNIKFLGNSTIHNCIEIYTSFIILVSGLICVIYFLSLYSKYYLIIGCGFIISSFIHFIHGTSYLGIFNSISQNHISANYLDIIIPLLILYSYFINLRPKKSREPQVNKELIFYSISTILAITFIFFLYPYSKNLNVIYPSSIIPRPADFISSLLFLITSLIILIDFFKKRNIFDGTLFLFIFFKGISEVYLSFSLTPFDNLFVTAHILSSLSFFIPIIGLTLKNFVEIKKTSLINNRINFVTNLMPAGYWEKDLNNGELKWDNNMFKVLDVSPKSFTGKYRDWAKIIHPEDLKEVEQDISRDLTNKSNTSIEYRIIDNKGHIRHISDNIAIEYDKNKRQKTLIGISTDITKEKNIQNKLLYRLNIEEIVTSISTNFLKADTEIDESINFALRKIGNFVEADECRLFQFSNDEETFNNTHEFCEEDLDLKQNELQNLSVKEFQWLIQKLKSESVVYIPDIISSPDIPPHTSNLFKKLNFKTLLASPIYQNNHLFGFLLLSSKKSITLWPEEDTSMLKLIGNLILDIIIRHKRYKDLLHSKEELRKNEMKFSNLFNNSHDIILICDEMGEIINYNKAWGKLFNYKNYPLHINEINKYIHYEDIDLVKEIEKKLSRGNQIKNSEIRFMDNQQKLYFEINAFALEIQKQKNFYIIAHNITELKQHENLIKKKNIELENYTYFVSHDLKEPVRSISHLSQYMKEDYYELLPPRGKEYLERIINASKRMGSLIEDLLVMSRVNRKYTNFSHVNLNEVLIFAKDDLSQLLASKNATINYPELPTIYCQETLITEVFKNLISNGIKYNNNNNPQVNISYTEKSNYFIFSVEDNGIGINPEHFNKIFEAFTRLHSYENYEGTGAGLYISKIIIEKHEGRIWVDSSSPQEGTIIKFTISKNLK